jgi:glutamate-1-semialdehyde 2,1-aminomutase
VFNVSFGLTGDVPDFRAFAVRDVGRQRPFFAALQERGVRITPEGTFFVSTAHTDEDVDRTITAVADAVRSL